MGPPEYLITLVHENVFKTVIELKEFPFQKTQQQQQQQKDEQPISVW